MPEIQFTVEERAVIVRKIQAYFSEELDQPIGQFDAQFLLDFMASQMGVYFYNRGLYDAQAMLASRVEDLQDAILQLEQPIDGGR